MQGHTNSESETVSSPLNVAMFYRKDNYRIYIKMSVH